MLVRDVARVRSDKVIGEYDRYNMRRLVSMTANIDGEDLGHVLQHIARALEATQAMEPKGALPKGVQVDVRGQAPPLLELRQGLTFGLAVAVAVIFLLL